MRSHFLAAGAAVACTVLNVSYAFAQGAQVSPGTVNPGITDSASPTDRIERRPQMFAGALLDDARARQIVGAAGYSLIDFYKCGFASDECALFQVFGPNGNVFRFQVSSEACKQIAGGPALDRDRIQRSRQALRVAQGTQQVARTAGAGSPTDPVDVGGPDRADKFDQAQLGPQSGQGSAPCFGGYAIDYRLREDVTMYWGPLGNELNFQQRLQIGAEDGWRDVLTFRSASWDMLVEWGRGLSDVGWSVEIADPDGEVLASEGESAERIAGSAPSGDLTLPELCKIREDATWSPYEAVIEAQYTACEVATVTMPDQADIKADLTILGVGATVNAQKNQAICENIRTSGNAIIKAGRAQTYDDCINNPGKFFPSRYPPQEGTITAIVVGDPDFVAPFDYVYQASASGNCPLTDTREEKVDFMSGVQCVADVTYQCRPNFATGACECRDPDIVENSMVCF